MSPKDAAEQVLNDLSIASLDVLKDNLESIVWYRRRALIKYEPLDGAEARLCVMGDRAIIRISDKIKYLPRKRFGIAHELGHLELHTSSGIHFDKNLDAYRKREKEREANEFASAFLMPKRFFLPKITETPRLEMVEELKDLFWTSWTATAIRLIDLCPLPMAVVYSENYKVSWSKENKILKGLGIQVQKSGRLNPMRGIPSEAVTRDHFLKAFTYCMLK
jgi:Zn-dependent peptidase ImmA (M78 family)